MNLATQSSVHSYNGIPRNADLAVDGDSSSDFYNNSCTHTALNGSSDPWWSVPLPGRYLITEVHIYNRDGDCDGALCGERLSPLEVYVTDDDEMKLCASHTESTSDILIVKVQCGVYQAGGILTIVLPGPGRILTLCEVRAFWVKLP